MHIDLMAGLALALVFGGLLPAISPSTYKRAVFELASLSENHIRSVGLGFMVAGAVLLYLIR